MNLNRRQMRLVGVYKQLYKYKDLLKNAPVLSCNLENIPDSELPNVFAQMEGELNSVIGYLLGMRGELKVNSMLEAINTHYKKEDFWRNLLLDFVEIKQEEAEHAIKEEKKVVQEDGLEIYAKLREFQKRRKEIIESFSEKIKGDNFPIDAKRLFKNYLNMADIDPKQAWEVLISNPAFFSPLIVEDANGKRTLSIKDAKDVNKKIGARLKKIKA